MKKKLLLLSVILASQTSFGQLTQANEPAAGSNVSMHVVDTGTVTLASIAAVSGTNVEWNYTGAVISLNNTQAVTVADATGSTDFPTSTKSISQGQIVQYFNSTSTQRVSQGFVFNEPTFGQVVAKFTTNEAILLAYPFAYGSSLNDTYAGSAVTTLGNIPLTGKVYSTIDGTGTLKLPGDDYPNVFRLTTIDTTKATFLSMDIEVIRTQYEYYDLSVQNLPIFIDATIAIGGDSERQVLSKNYSTIGLEKNAIQNLVLYPNPSNGEFTISGEFAKGNVEVTDLTGKVVYTSEVMSGATIKLSDVKSGIYTVKISTGDKASVQKITIK